MVLSDFDGWMNIVWLIIFTVIGSVLVSFSRSRTQDPEGWRKTYKWTGILGLVLAGINAILVIGKAYYASQMPGKEISQVMDAVVPNGNPIVRNGNTYYNARRPVPTRAELLANQYAPGPSRANLLRQQATKIPNTPVA